MMAPLGIAITSEGPLVYVRMVDHRNSSTMTAVLNADQARELARMIRNAANFVAAQAPAEGNA